MTDCIKVNTEHLRLKEIKKYLWVQDWYQHGWQAFHPIHMVRTWEDTGPMTLISQLAELGRESPCRWDLVLTARNAGFTTGFGGVWLSQCSVLHSQWSHWGYSCGTGTRSPHIMQKGRLEQGPIKINITQLLPWGAPFLQLLATVIKWGGWLTDLTLPIKNRRLLELDKCL